MECSDGSADQVQGVFGKWKRTASGFVLTTGALVFGAVVLGISFLATSDTIMAVPTVNQAVKIVQTEVMIETATMEAKVEDGGVDYYLPYPGVLPDNPLYKLKAVRDKLSLWFEFDEEQKAEKELQYADKRINAAMFLTQGGKLGLGVTTASKAEKYLEQAAERAIKLDKGGKDVKSLLNKLATASAKHLEIIDILMERAGEDELNTLKLSSATTKLMAERLGQVLLEAK